MESNLRTPHQNTFNHVIKCFEESVGLTERDQTKEDQHMAITSVNNKRIDNYFTADLSSICTVSHNLNISYSLYHSKITCLMFRGLTPMCWSSSAWPILVMRHFYEALDDAVEGISIGGFKLLSL